MATMRLLVFLLTLTPLASAQFLDLRIVFQGTDCVSCAESLEGRLARVRGVEAVELDLESSTVRLVLEAGNKVRLAPLRARITQDGTKIVSMEAVCRGEAVEAGGGRALQPLGLSEHWPLDGQDLPAAGSVGVASGTIVDGRFELKQWEADSPDQ
jgi:copper chaperone CopZ